jgi:hypothetical protein
LRRTDMMAMLQGLRGQVSHMRWSCSLLLVPREAGEYPSLSGLFRVHSGARMDQDGREAPVQGYDARIWQRV